MNLKATVLGAVGVTAVAGTLIFNTDAAEKVMTVSYTHLTLPTITAV